VPSVSISHVILTVALLTLFIEIAFFTSTLTLKYNVRVLDDTLQDLAYVVQERVERVALFSKSLGYDRVVVLELGIPNIVGNRLYYMYLDEYADHVKVKVTCLTDQITSTTTPIYGVRTLATISDADRVKIIELLSSMGINIDYYGLRLYSGVSGKPIVWSIYYSSLDQVIVGLGWIET